MSDINPGNMPIIIRIGQGGKYLDNDHAGGMFCAVYNDGTMGNHAVTEFNDQFIEPPDTHLIFAVHRVEYLDKVIEAARRMHSFIPQIGVVNWDFTINEEEEAVLIESNVKNGSVWLPQMAHGTVAFGDKTEEVLQWLRFMKKLKPHERILYSHGKGVCLRGGGALWHCGDGSAVALLHAGHHHA